MSSRRLVSLALASIATLSFGCAEETPPPPPPPPPPPVMAAVVEAPPPPPAPPEPTPEEKKKAEEAQKLAADRAEFEAEHQTEMARWTPDMHKAAAAVAGKTYPTGHAAIQATIAGTYRRPGDAARDPYRHPLQTLDFLGFKPTMTVLEVGPGEGWYTELLAPALAKQGKLIATSADPNGPADKRSTLYAQKFKGLLDTSPELYGKVQTLVVDGKEPHLGLDKSVDLVLFMREVHGFQNQGTFVAWLNEVNKALKPGGILGIEEHRAKPGSDSTQTAKKGYMDEKFVIDTVTANGFKLAGKSEINANAKDTKDYPEGVWSLPPTYEEKDVNHAKYAAIGESDRMTLKFVKTSK